MKTNVQQTSIDAYHALHLSNQEKEVIRAFLVIGDSCVADVAKFLHWEKSTVAARVNMLKTPADHFGKGVLEFAGRRKSVSTGITSMFYRLK